MLRVLSDPRWVALIIVLFSLHFVMKHFKDSAFYIDLERYKEGTEQVVFQSRWLMSQYLEWADSQPFWSWTAARMPKEFQNPLIVSLVPVAWLSMAGGFWLVWDAARKLTRSPWAGPVSLLLVFWFTSSAYLLSVTQDFLYPYDHLSFLAFTLSTYLIVMRKEAWLFLLIPFAALNREVVVMLIPLLILFRWSEWDWRRHAWTTLVLGLLWFAARQFVARQIAGTAAPLESPSQWGGMEIQLFFNLGIYHYPLSVLNVLTACGFLFPIWMSLAMRVENPGLRRAQLVMVPVLILYFVFAILSEVRIFGEFIPLAVLCIMSALDSFVPEVKKAEYALVAARESSNGRPEAERIPVSTLPL